MFRARWLKSCDNLEPIRSGSKFIIGKIKAENIFLGSSLGCLDPLSAVLLEAFLKPCDTTSHDGDCDAFNWCLMAFLSHKLCSKWSSYKIRIGRAAQGIVPTAGSLYLPVLLSLYALSGCVVTLCLYSLKWSHVWTLNFQDSSKAHGVVRSALSSQLEAVDDVVGQEVAVVELGEIYL